jgi:hypothetical protein
MIKDSINKTENSSEITGMEQPLMSTGTVEEGFDWNTNQEKRHAEPKIGNTTVGEEES